MLDIFFWIVFGGVVGWIAAILRQVHGLERVLSHIAAGMVGGILGGSGGGLVLAGTQRYHTDITNMMLAIFGAIVCIALARLAADLHSR